jgi:hypothetical protein
VKLYQPRKKGTYKRIRIERNEGHPIPGAGNYHFHPAFELSRAGVAAPATGTSESVAVAAGWTENGSSSVAQPVITKRLAIASEVALTKQFIKNMSPFRRDSQYNNNLALAPPIVGRYAAVPEM